METNGEAEQPTKTITVETEEEESSAVSEEAGSTAAEEIKAGPCRLERPHVQSSRYLGKKWIAY